MSLLDINEQKEAAESLRETRDYLDNLFNYADTPIIVWNRDLKITRFNRAAERLTGRSADEMPGKKVDILFPPDKRREALEQVNRTVIKGERWETVEIPIQNVDGSSRIVLWNSATLFEADGKTPIATIASGQDITERKRAEDNLILRTGELEASKKALEAANQELESFAYSVSHDLKAPLRAMDGFSEAAITEYGDKLGEEGKDYLERVRTASQTMARLIDDLLKLSRVSRSDFNREKVDLTDLVTSISKDIKATQPERQVDLIIQPGLSGQADRQLLTIALRNLLENSWKYTRKCKQSRIEFGSTGHDEMNVYYLKDNGIGFDMKYADKLFRPFSRLHSDKEFQGTGIGLATVQRIVKRHGGRIWAESEKSKGATFFFTLDNRGQTE